MRIDLVILVMLVSWIALGFTGNELINTTEDLNACEASVTQTIGSLKACQTESNRLGSNLGTCQAQLTGMTTERDQAKMNLATCQSQLSGAQSELIRVNQVLSACNPPQGSGDPLISLNTAHAVESPARSVSTEISGWPNAVAAIVAAVTLIIRRTLAARRVRSGLPDDTIRVTESERKLIIQLRRKTR